MSATGSGAGSGLVLGIVFVLLGQQFGLLSLSALVPAIEYIVIGAVIGGVIGGIIGYGLGRLYAHRHPPTDPTNSAGASSTPPP